MALQLNLEKAKEALRLSLQKAGVDTNGLMMDISFDLDVSGSFEDEHRDGSTNDLLTRFVPWSLLFDPDGKLDLFTFSNRPEHVHYVGEVTAKNYAGYVRANIIGKVPGWNGGTDYSYVLERNLQHFGWLGGGADKAPAKGLFGGLFGGKKAVASQPEVTPRKSLVIFITDGDNSDEDRTRQILRASQERGDGIYFLFVGYSNQGGKFPFLNKIADEFDNTGLVIVRDIPKFVAQDDDALNQELLGDELLTWLKKR